MAIYYAFELSYDYPNTDIKKVEEHLEGPFDLVYDVVTLLWALSGCKSCAWEIRRIKAKGLSISDASENNEPFENGKWN